MTSMEVLLFVLLVMLRVDDKWDRAGLFLVLCACLINYGLVEAAGKRPGDFDRDLDGRLDTYEQHSYEIDTGKKANDLRGGLYLEPEIVRPYARNQINSGENKIEY